MTKYKALRLALEALGWTDEWRPQGLKEEAITAIKAALEAKEEPVGLIESLKDAKPCCGQYETCWRACTPRGKFIGHRDAQRSRVVLTPACPKGLTEFECEVEGVDLVCFLEYTPEEEGSRDSYGLLNEPGTSENLELVNAYVKGTDVDIGHLLLQYLVDHITTTALEDFKNDDL